MSAYDNVTWNENDWHYGHWLILSFVPKKSVDCLKRKDWLVEPSVVKFSLKFLDGQHHLSKIRIVSVLSWLWFVDLNRISRISYDRGAFALFANAHWKCAPLLGPCMPRDRGSGSFSPAFRSGFPFLHSIGSPHACVETEHPWPMTVPLLSPILGWVLEFCCGWWGWVWAGGKGSRWSGDILSPSLQTKLQSEDIWRELLSQGNLW